jgi:hypothetical protein
MDDENSFILTLVAFTELTTVLRLTSSTWPDQMCDVGQCPVPSS